MEVVANVFKRKKQQFTVTPADPTYSIRYLGNVRTLLGKGEGCTESEVRKLWKKTNQGKTSAKIKLTISVAGLKLEGLNKDRQPMTQLYKIHRIPFRCVDKSSRRVFCWVYRHERKHKQVELRVHAAMCSKPDQAEEIFANLHQLCNSSFADYKREKRDKERITEQTSGAFLSGHLPTVPLRRLINTRSHFLPPLEKTQNAPKLDSLCEEEDEEIETVNNNEQTCDDSGSDSNQEDKQDFGVFESLEDSNEIL